MADIINLNRFRKEKAAQAKKRRVPENRVRHGRSREERLREKEEARRHNTDLDGKRLDD